MSPLKFLPRSQDGSRAHVYEGAEPQGGRRMPDMRVVTKGWWTLREERRSVEELEKADRDERKQA